MKAFIALLVGSLTLAFAHGAEQRQPNLSGSWVLVRSATKLQAFSIESLGLATLEVAQSHNLFTVRRTFVVDGRESTFGFELPVGEKELVATSGGQTRYSRLYWENDALVYSTRIVEASGESTCVVHYRLTPDGKRLVEHESRKGTDNYTNLWVFTRQP